MTGTRRSRLHFVSRKWPPAMGGMETYSHRLAEALGAHAEVEPTVLAGRADGRPPHVRALLLWGIRACFAAATGPRREATLVADMSIWPIAAIARQRGGRVAIAAHGTDVAFPARGGLVGRAYGLWLRLGARLCPGVTVIANSRATAALARERGFARVAVVALAADPLAIAERDGGPAAGRHLLFAGRIEPRKGLAWFVGQVMPRLDPAIRLHVAGTIWDPREAAALDDPRVVWLGRLEPGALAREYARAGAVILPNIEVAARGFEGFGLVAAEAAASGGVVLAAGHGGLADAVIDGETGLLLPPGDAAAWAEAVTRVLAWTPETGRAFRDHAAARARAHFSWARVARETAGHLGLQRHPPSNTG